MSSISPSVSLAMIYIGWISEQDLYPHNFCATYWSHTPKLHQNVNCTITLILFIGFSIRHNQRQNNASM